MAVLYGAQAMALLPLLVLYVLAMARQVRDVSYWCVAGAFALSFLADTLAAYVNPNVTTLAYPLGQSAVIAAIFMDRRRGHLFVYAMIVIGLVALCFLPTHDRVLRSFAWGVLSWCAWQRRMLGDVVVALLVSFGGGLVAWWEYCLWPGWETWLAYQGVRLAGILLFCVAAMRDRTQLRLVGA